MPIGTQRTLHLFKHWRGGVDVIGAVLAQNPVGMWHPGAVSGSTALNVGTGGSTLNATLTDIDLDEPVYVPTAPNAASNGTFVDGTGWTVTNGGFTFAGSASCDGSQPGTTELFQAALAGYDGQLMRLTFTLSNVSAGFVIPKVGSSGLGSTRSTNGTFTQDIVKAGNDNLIFTCNSAFVGDIDNVSVRPVTAVPGLTGFKTNLTSSLMTVANDAALADLDSFTVVVGAVVRSPGENNGGRFFAWGNEEHEAWIDSTGALNLEIDRATSNDSSASPADTVIYGEMGLFVFECANGVADLQHASNAGTLADVGTRTPGSGSVVDETADLNLLNLGNASATQDATVVFIALYDDIDQYGLDSITATLYGMYSGLVV